MSRDGDQTKMRSKSVSCQTSTNSESNCLSSSSTGLSSGLRLSARLLRCPTTLAKILLVTFDRGMLVSMRLSSGKCLAIDDSNATASPNSKVSSSKLLNAISTASPNSKILLPDHLVSSTASIGIGNKRHNYLQFPLNTCKDFVASHHQT
ncbi:hypothetical protein U1Q18_014005, partial [Sarracenia purpurea var. burkii]